MTNPKAPLLSRRQFLHTALAAAGTVVAGTSALEAFADEPGDVDTRFVVLSDTHVGSPGDAARLERAIAWIHREKPAFVLHTGDVVEHLVTNAEEIAVAQRLLGRLTCPVHLVPGNHDVGQEDRAEVRRLWRATFGPAEQVVRHGAWRFVGFDSLALAQAASSPTLEDEVFGFLEAESSGLAGGRTVLFYHVPEILLPFGSAIAWSDTALKRWDALLERVRPAAALAGHWHVGVQLQPAAHPLFVAPPISGRGDLPTGYLRCSLKGEMLLCERVMIETQGKRDLPGPVQWLLLPQGRAPGGAAPP